jgi:redox-sensitive bicupin YhaK (pirin superfamily)
VDVSNPLVSSPVIERFQLGFQWPTVDPFLFCVHHLDHYPVGNGRFGPAASLVGREIGQDFAGLDGWRMYHGDTVPGFPQHPHRGFETITFVRQGFVDHADSLGAAARYGNGDVQWLTAGAGIVHAEMFPLLDTETPNTVELFQIWLNLPRVDKFAEPHFSMLWADSVPAVEQVGVDGATATVTVVAGKIGDAVPPSPPPQSWAGRAESDVAVWNVHLEPGAAWDMPAATGSGTVRVVYSHSGGEVHLGADRLVSGAGAVVDCSGPVRVSSPSGGECLVLQGRPIGEPVAQYGPFVMNDRAGVEQAFRDYQLTHFGGWPWANDDPVHGDEPQRFARRPAASAERPTAPPG